MIARPVIWLAGAAGSVLAHGGLLALVLLSIRPEPVEEQPMPGSELEVQAYQLDREQARERPAEADRAREADAEGAALNAGAIPRTQAATEKPAGRPAAEARPAAEKLQPKAETGGPVAAAAPEVPVLAAAPQQARPAAKAAPEPVRAAPVSVPAPTAIAAAARPAQAAAKVAPAAVVLAVARPGQNALPLSVPDPVTLAPAVDAGLALPDARPEAPAAPAAEPDVSQLPPAPAEVAVAASGEPEAASVDPSEPPATQLTAALAFSGADGDVDPVSLAAFQSFMRPGDAAAAGEEMRDGIAGLLAQVPCSRLQVGFDPDSATLQVNGHVPENGLQAPVLAALRDQMGADIAVSDNILILPRPQCGALSGIADVGLPQSTDQFTNPLVIGADTHARVFRFTKGNLLSLDMTAPDYDAFIYLDYFDADGNVLHLEPNEYAPLRQAAAKAAQQIGARTAQDAGLKLVIGPPYGQEIAVAFAASVPLYDELRPIQEPAAPYLEWLKQKVAGARATHDDFKGEWIYFFVATAEQ